MSIEATLLVVLIAFGVFRTAEALTLDDGPFGVFLRWRILVGVYDRDATGQPAKELGRLFECPYCVGMWLSLLGAVGWFYLYHFPFAVSKFFLVWLAIAGMQSALQTMCGRKND